jgi:hypothetical protein
MAEKAVVTAWRMEIKPKRKYGESFEVEFRSVDFAIPGRKKLVHEARL